jgi:hypothetical protein
MSEHIQPAPGTHPSPHAPAAETEAERTPGVAHEKSEFSLRLVLWTGFGLIVTAVIVHVAVWAVFVRDIKSNQLPPGSEPSLAVEDANRPLEERLLDVPPPHLEGIEPESSLLVLRVGEHEDRRFVVGPDTRVRIDKKEKARLFELREGQQVTITYYMPAGANGFGIVTSVISPPDKSAKQNEHALPGAMHTLTATVLLIEPRSVAAARQWAEVQMERYSWADRKKEVARIPVTAAMDEVLKEKEFQPPKKKNDRPLTAPTRTNSGRGTEEEKK